MTGELSTELLRRRWAVSHQRAVVLNNNTYTLTHSEFSRLRALNVYGESACMRDSYMTAVAMVKNPAFWVKMFADAGVPICANIGFPYR